MMQNPILEALSAAGVSVWLDDLSRDHLTSGNLQQLIWWHHLGHQARAHAPRNLIQTANALVVSVSAASGARVSVNVFRR
jgi:hypothetical protein